MRVLSASASACLVWSDAAFGFLSTVLPPLADGFIYTYIRATRHVVPLVFIAVALLGLHFSNKCPYAYGYSSLTTPKLSESQIADNMIADNFTSSNMLALVVPAGDYE